MRGSVALVLFATLISITPSAGADDNYPDRRVRIVLPYTPGTGADTHTRMLVAELERALEGACHRRQPAGRQRIDRRPDGDPGARRRLHDDGDGRVGVQRLHERSAALRSVEGAATRRAADHGAVCVRGPKGFPGRRPGRSSSATAAPIRTR